MLWQTSRETDDATDLLGATEDWLIAAGSRLYWISRREDDGGHIKHIWPDGPHHLGCGRGLLTADAVVWPTHDSLLFFDPKTAEPLKTIDLASRGATGGNLLLADQRLLITTSQEWIAIAAQSHQPRP
jgi:hypothetical protein